MPNGEVFMVLVIISEVVVAVLIVGRGTVVEAGVVASVIWVLAVLPFLAWPYLITDIGFAGLPGFVAVRSYRQSRLAGPMRGFAVEALRRIR